MAEEQKKPKCLTPLDFLMLLGDAGSSTFAVAYFTTPTPEVKTLKIAEKEFISHYPLINK